MYYDQILWFSMLIMWERCFIHFVAGDVSQNNDYVNEYSDKRYSYSFNYSRIERVENALNFSGKVALVTGSNSGIGAEAVRLLSYLGAQVVVTGRNTTRIRQVAIECYQLSPNKYKPLEVTADLTIKDELEHLFYQTIKTYGKIDILVNVAGIYTLSNLTAGNFTKNFYATTAINEVATIMLTKLAIPFLKKTNGTVVCIASESGINPLIGEGAYGMSKAAIILFTKTLSIEIGPYIRVNSISPAAILGTRGSRYEPGAIERIARRFLPLTPLQRLGNPMDVAKAIIFLASPLSEWITGFNLQLNGGLE